MTFNLSGEEERRAQEFMKKQDAVWLKRQLENKDLREHVRQIIKETNEPYYGAIGGAYEYTFSPNGVGTVIKIKHKLSGESADVTDYSSW